VVDSHAEQDPEGGSNAKRVTALETACGCGGRNKALEGDPKSGSSMK
jgi:hypothetical protein